MLLRFRVTNHASIRDQQELSMIASDPRPDRAEFPVAGTHLHTVPVAAIFGANASGKSNFIDALTWMRHAVLSSFGKWEPAGPIPRVPFRLRPDAHSQDSTYEIDFLIDDTRYEFGFRLDGKSIKEEWLYYFPEGKRRKLYVRSGATPDTITFGRWLTGRRKTISELVRSNSLYLSVAAAQGHPQLGAVHYWFRHGLRTASDNNFDERLSFTIDLYQKLLETYPENPQTAVSLIRAADLGVAGFQLEEEDESAQEEYQKLVAAVRNIMGGRFAMGPSKPRHQINVEHRTSSGTFTLSLADESNGTRTWIGLMGPVLLSLMEGTVLCVDELDARLHPYLADMLVGLFQSPDTNKNGAQLVCNTHDATLLGQNSKTDLHRDQIWLTERDHRTGATQLFPVTEFRVRDSPESRDNMEKRYLSGRYGAVPFLDVSLVRQLIDQE